MSLSRPADCETKVGLLDHIESEIAPGSVHRPSRSGGLDRLSTEPNQAYPP